MSAQDNHASKEDFSSWLERKMKEAGLNQTTLAEKIGVTRQAVSDYLNKGSKPRGERVRPLADALNISEAELAARIEGADPSVPEDVKDGGD